MKTAEQYRREAEDYLRRRDESFERSDTDGFLSQWALGLNAQLASTQAKLMENNKLDQFTGLYEGTRRVAAKLINGKFGWVWMLRDDEENKFGRKFIPDGPRSRVQKKLGLSERKEMAPAWARITGSGTGLSGNAWVEVYRTGDKCGLDAELTTDELKKESLKKSKKGPKKLAKRFF